MVAIVNPTAILNKERPLQLLGADVVALSETSAVHAAQQIMTPKLRTLGFRCHWGAPVPSHFHEASSRPSLRGYAAGVAVLSRMPSFQSPHALPPEVLESCRIVEAFVRFGSLPVRVLTLYGIPRDRGDGLSRTNALVEIAVARAQSSAAPCLLCGDFNHPIHSLSACAPLLEAGYREAHSYFEVRTGEHLPATCRDSTSNDTMLIHPALLPLWDTAWVHKGHPLFDSHDPLCVKFRVPEFEVTRGVWTSPKCWAALEPSPQGLSSAFARHAPAVALAVASVATPRRWARLLSSGRALWRHRWMRPYASSMSRTL